MKKKMLALAAMAVAFTTLADTWEDPKTGITWTYTVSGGCASVGGGVYSYPAVPRSTTGTITIPSTLGGCPVTSIGDWAFSHCSGLTSVTIPSSVTSIGDLAFQSCSGLTSVTIPEGVTRIGQYAFSGCSGLGEGVVVCDGWVLCVNGDCPTAVTIPTGAKGIAGGAFSGCKGLTSVTIPESVTRIGDCAFGGCGGLTSVTIPSSVTSVGEYAFSGCSGLKTVSVDAGDETRVRTLLANSRVDCSNVVFKVRDSLRRDGGGKKTH